MASDVNVRRLLDAAVIFREGTAADGMYSIVSGKVRIYREEHGHETTLSLLHPGDFFGELALLDRKPRSASAQAVGDTEVRFISAAEFDGMVSDPFLRHMLVKMSERLRHVDEALSKLDAENVARHSYLENLSMHRDWAV